MYAGALFFADILKRWRQAEPGATIQAMRSLKNRLLALILVFIAASAVSLAIRLRAGQEDGEAVYTASGEPELPVIRVETCGKLMNVMYGVLGGSASDLTYDTLTILPEGRRLTVSIEENGAHLNGIRYEIRSADLSRFIERTEVTDFSPDAESQRVELPIENLISPGAEYRLDLILSAEGCGEVHYYSRIAFDTQGRSEEMVRMADDFSLRNFSYESARENTMFLETDETGDNTTLGRVNLKSNYDQLTYGKLGVRPVGVRDVRLLEYTGNSGVVEVRSFAEASPNGKRALYELTESFSLRVGAERIYMMDYDRRMHELFDGDPGRVSGSRIRVGITEEDAIGAAQSPDGKSTAFTVSGSLWLYRSADASLTHVAGDPGGDPEHFRESLRMNDIRVVSCGDGGELLYLLFGYMNGGPHEGLIGVSLFRYDPESSVPKEVCFIPSGRSFEEIGRDLGIISKRGAGSMLYLKLGTSLYGIDTDNGEYIAVTDLLFEGCYTVSREMTRAAWQTASDRNGSERIQFLDLETGSGDTITAEDGSLLKPLGFIGTDLALGVAQKGNVWMNNGVERGIPFGSIRILDRELKQTAEYRKQDRYVTDVSVEGMRIHLKRLKKISQGIFVFDERDTFICSEKEQITHAAVSAPDEVLETLWYVPAVEYAKDKVFTVQNAGAARFGGSQTLRDLGTESGRKQYLAYGHGKLLGVYDQLGPAVNAAYDEMGLVRSGGSMVYLRAATNGLRTLKDPETLSERILAAHEEGRLSDLIGAGMRAVLNYVSRGVPVLGYSEDGEAYVIYGYDRSDVLLYDVSAGGRVRMRIEDAEELFDRGWNDFSCDIAALYVNP